jgi:hypothetical protein
LGAIKLGDRAQNLAAMTERSDTEVFQVLVRQIAEDREVDIVVSKALGVLGHSEFFEPISNLLHRRLYRRLSEPKAYHYSPQRCRPPSLKSASPSWLQLPTRGLGSEQQPSTALVEKLTY